MRVLAIGGTGFIGRRTVAALTGRGHDVWTLGRGPGQGRHLTGDRSIAGGLQRALGQHHFDAVVDLAGYQLPEMEDVVALFRSSVVRYVFVSSGVVHRDLHGRPAREEDAVLPEGEPPPGELDYTSGKRWCEALLLFARHEGFPAVVVRPPAVLGREDRTARIVAYLARVEDGGPLLVPQGLGDRRVALAWSRDVGELCAFLVDSEAPAFAYNIAFPDLTLRGFLEQAADALAVDAPLLVEASDAALARKGLDPDEVWPYGPSPDRPGGYDLRRIRELGFEPSPLSTALAETVEWFRTERPEAPGYARRAAELELAAHLRRK
jgi:nucleoside-diphosphate-sugar epimerase